MDMERMNRLVEAKKYQEKAIKTLFPENMQGHIEVIQKEMRSMVKEGVFQLLQSEEGMELLKNMMSGTDQEVEKKTESKAKKVDIS